MWYTLTWMPDENAFRIRREDGELAYLQAPLLRKLVSSSAEGLRSTLDRAMKNPGKPVRFESGAPAECGENYQRSLVPAGSEDARSLRNPIR